MYKTSHSKAKTSRRCHRAYYYRYVLKIRKRVKSKALIIGTLVHSCLESYFSKGHYIPEIKKWKDEEYSKMFVEEQSLHADVVPMVKALIRGYIKSWGESELEMEWVEKEFEVEISPGIVLVGKVDGVAKDPKGRRWLVEHKTCKTVPGEEARIFDTQALLYARVLPQLGEKPVSGVIWDYLRKKLPVKPELLKSGGLSKRKNIDTTADVYLREIKRHGLDPRGYEDILSDLESKKTDFYRQVKLPLNKPMTDRVMEELIITSNQMMDLEERHSRGEDVFARNLTRDCSWCDYALVCHAELRGDDTEYLMKHDYVRKTDEKEDQEISE